KSAMKNKKEPKTLDTQRFLALLQLLPLNSSRWFRGNIIYNPVHLINFLCDSFTNLIQYIPINSCPIGRHPINGMHRTNTDRIMICSCVISHSDTSNVPQHCEVSPNRTIQSCYFTLFTQNGICFTNDG